MIYIIARFLLLILCVKDSYELRLYFRNNKYGRWVSVAETGFLGISLHEKQLSNMVEVFVYNLPKD